MAQKRFNYTINCVGKAGFYLGVDFFKDAIGSLVKVYSHSDGSDFVAPRGFEVSNTIFHDTDKNVTVLIKRSFPHTFVKNKLVPPVEIYKLEYRLALFGTEENIIEMESILNEVLYNKDKDIISELEGSIREHHQRLGPDTIFGLELYLREHRQRLGLDS